MSVIAACSRSQLGFSALADIFDPGTIRHLTGLGVAEGWHCVEVGGGEGSIAHSLSAHVGVGGRVVVTDIDTRFRYRSRSHLSTLGSHSTSSGQISSSRTQTTWITMNCPIPL